MEGNQAEVSIATIATRNSALFLDSGNTSREEYTLERKVKMMIKYLIIVLGLSFTLGIASCKKGEQEGEQIPNTPVSLQVNLDLPAYFDLTNLGNWMYFPDGYDGIILYHAFDGEYYAFDRACSYEPFKDCSELWMDSTTRVNMNCGSYKDGIFTKCCDSRFEIPSGFPVEGPARRAMKAYAVNRNGNTLYISN